MPPYFSSIIICLHQKQNHKFLLPLSQTWLQIFTIFLSASLLLSSSIFQRNSYIDGISRRLSSWHHYCSVGGCCASYHVQGVAVNDGWLVFALSSFRSEHLLLHRPSPPRRCCCLLLLRSLLIYIKFLSLFMLCISGLFISSLLAMYNFEWFHM